MGRSTNVAGFFCAWSLVEETIKLWHYEDMKTILRAIVLLGIVVALVWYGLRLSAPEEPIYLYGDTPPATILYACDAGKTITATFTEFAPPIPTNDPNMPPTPNGTADIVLSDGRTLTLNRTLSADGIRYANADESFVFWNKGNGALVLENNVEKSYIGCIAVSERSEEFANVYHNSSMGFTMRTPAGYTTNEEYVYEMMPNKKIYGVKFTIPATLSAGTNLGSAYIAVEQIPQASSCTADLFLEQQSEDPMLVRTINEQGEEYSYATTTGAAAGNRYGETIYAIPGTNPCTAVRYFIHYSNIQNYPEGAVREFDSAALLNHFDAIRKTLILN